MKYDNVTYGGPFKNTDKPELYNCIDMIHSIYGNEDLATSTLWPNRLYDAVIFKKPLLASTHTYLAQVVEKYNLGVNINIKDPNFMLILNNYVNNFNKQKFLAGSNEFLDLVNSQQKLFLDKIREFFFK